MALHLPPERRSDEQEQKSENMGETELKRGLGRLHLQFIGLGSAIATGLFLGSSTSLANAGPASCLIAFAVVGIILYSVMTSLAEMAAFMPISGGLTVYASKFIDPSVGFAMGWIYWFSWAVTYALELTAAGLILQYWNPSVSIGISVTVFWVVITAVNLLPVHILGQVELYLSSIKVITIIGFVIFAICINAGAGKEGYIGFKYWADPGAFAEYIVGGSAGKFIGFWSVLVTAGFSYQGSELVGIAAGEAKDPSTSIPFAIKSTFWGVLSLFLATILFTGLLVPYTNPDLKSGSTNAAASSMVIAVKLAGVPVLPHIINAVLLTAVLSAATADLYSGSRILLALAKDGLAPKFITRTNGMGVPWIAVVLTGSIGLLGLLNISQNGSNVFSWLLNITAVAGFIAWCIISTCHLRFMRCLKLHGISRSTLPYRAPLQPYLAWFGLAFCLLITLTNGFTVFISWSTGDFFAAYISLILFLIMWVGYKVIYRTQLANLAYTDPHIPCEMNHGGDTGLGKGNIQVRSERMEGNNTQL